MRRGNMWDGAISEQHVANVIDESAALDYGCTLQDARWPSEDEE